MSEQIEPVEQVSEQDTLSLHQSLGRAAYDSFRQSSIEAGNNLILDASLCEWEALAELAQEAWMKAASAAVNEFLSNVHTTGITGVTNPIEHVERGTMPPVVDPEDN